MSGFKDAYDLEMALAVVGSESVAWDTWVEAAKWLLLFGPDDLRQILTDSAGLSFQECFPSLKPVAYSEDGQPCYHLGQLAEVLGVDPAEAEQVLAETEWAADMRLLFTGDDTLTPQ
ncbi:MAG: hypothetical protein AB1634_19135 [Thermodesulfobacteriota bacterium]